MPIAKTVRVPSRFVTLATFVVVVAVLRFTEDITIPLAIALLLAFLLSPMVVRLMRWGLPKVVAVALTTTIAFSVVGLAGWHITNQAMALLEEVPKYEANLQAKIAALKRPEATNSLSRALSTIERMQSDLIAASSEPRSTARNDGKGTPVPVEVKTADRTSVDIAEDVLQGLVRPLGTAGVVIVFVVAILFQREDLRNRFIRVISGGQLNIATQAVEDAAQRVSRYLVAQLMVNTSFGLCIGTGLFFIGVPHAALWGLLATLLRFIPFLGPIIAASFPLVLSIAVDPGWTMLFWTIGLFVLVELVTNNVVEVWVYGTSTGISILALLTAAVFWSWLWGLAGLFLSTPLTVCLLVIGQYVPGLKFLGVLLGSAPPMEPSEQFYQRMLSMNQEEMFNAADAYVRDRSLAEFYDDVFIPALLMSEVDRHNGVLAEVRQKFIVESSAELIEELSERPTPPGDAAANPPAADPSQVILGLPARDEADELIARMLAHLLREKGLAVTVVAVTATPESYLETVKQHEATVIISALPPSTLSAAGRASRRVKQANPKTRVLIGVWQADTGMETLKHRLDPAGADAIATRLADAVVQVQRFLEKPATSKVPAPETKTTRSLERAEIKLTALKPEDATETITRELARAFDVPLSLVCVLETDPEFWKALSQRAPSAPLLEASVYADVLMVDTLLVVENVAKDDRYSTNPILVQRGVHFFASAPLRARGGHLVGNLCVLDTHPRTFGEAEIELIQSLAAQLMEVIDSDAATTVPESASG